MCNFCEMYEKLGAEQKKKVLEFMPQAQIKRKLKTTIVCQRYVKSDDRHGYSLFAEDTYGVYNIDFCPECGKDLRGKKKRRNK